MAGTTTCLNAGGKKILICNSLKKSIFDKFEPDIIILTGMRPEIDRLVPLGRFKGSFIMTGGTPARIMFPEEGSPPFDFTVHSVRRSGAFIRPL